MKYWVGRMQRDSETVQWCMTTRGLIKAIRAFEDEAKTWGWVSNQSFDLTYQETGSDKWEDAIWYTWDRDGAADGGYVVCGSKAAERDWDGRWRMVDPARIPTILEFIRAERLREEEEEAKRAKEDEEDWNRWAAAYRAEEARRERVEIAAMTKGCV